MGTICLRRIVLVFPLAWACAVLASAPVLAASPSGSRTNPIALHKMVAIPSASGWKVRVNSSTPNGTSAVMAANEFNSKPAAGHQFFIINVTESYSGKGQSNALEGLTLDALGRSNVAYDSSDDCGVVPDSISDTAQVFTGGSITGNICFSVKSSDAASLLLLAEPGFSLNNVTVFFKLR